MDTNGRDWKISAVNDNWESNPCYLRIVCRYSPRCLIGELWLPSSFMAGVIVQVICKNSLLSFSTGSRYFLLYIVYGESPLPEFSITGSHCWRWEVYLELLKGKIKHACVALPSRKLLSVEHMGCLKCSFFTLRCHWQCGGRFSRF
jgi:hypothetical protein